MLVITKEDLILSVLISLIYKTTYSAELPHHTSLPNLHESAYK